MIDRTPRPISASAAQRRVFHSKVDTIRPTYGFEDVSLAPGTDTIEPADVDLAQTFCGIELAIPILASAMDAVVDPASPARSRRLGGLAVLNLEGRPGAVRRPGRACSSGSRPRRTTRSRRCSPRPTSSRSART